MYNHPAADLEVNKNTLSISHFHDPSDDEFRHAASPSERLAAIQVHREAAYGKAAASARLQRVLMGVPPVRIEILNRIAGVNFTDCLSRAVTAEFDDIPVPPLSGYMSCRNLKMRLMSENLFLT